MDMTKKNIELENHAKCELLKANLSSTFSYRRAFLLGRQDALKNMDSSSRISRQRNYVVLEAYNKWFSNLSQEELVWYDGKYIETFLASYNT